MEGFLWKWTNYWNGWQTRWFVLEDGILSYHMSQDEVKQGCKGSLKVSALEIVVSNVDNTRMDLVIPGEKHIYLRAATSQERQQWLVALGSSKACVTMPSPQIQNKAAGEMLKSRKTELKLYADILIQQVHDVREAARAKDLERIEEGSNLLEITFDSFIKTLEHCWETNEEKPTGTQTSTKIRIVRSHQNISPKPVVLSTRVTSLEKKT